MLHYVVVEHEGYARVCMLVMPLWSPKCSLGLLFLGLQQLGNIAS